MTFNLNYARSHRRIGITTRKYNRVIYLKWHGFFKGIRLWPTQRRLWLRFSWLWPEKMKTAPAQLRAIDAWRQNVKRGTFAAFDTYIAKPIALAPTAPPANYEPKVLPKLN